MKGPRFLKMYVLYFNPADYPDKWVLRRFTVRHEGPLADQVPLSVEDSKEKALIYLPTHELYRLPRDPGDEPQIVEVWL
jgi:hypothetical protein